HATTPIYPLSLHDALPIYDLEVDVAQAALANPLPDQRGSISPRSPEQAELHLRAAPGGVQEQGDPPGVQPARQVGAGGEQHGERDRKSTRLNSSHRTISYA